MRGRRRGEAAARPACVLLHAPVPGCASRHTCWVPPGARAPGHSHPGSSSARLSTPPRPGKRQKRQKPLRGEVCLLTTGVLIRVRRGLGQQGTELIRHARPTPVFRIYARPRHALVLRWLSFRQASCRWCSRSASARGTVRSGHTRGAQPSALPRRLRRWHPRPASNKMRWNTGCL